LKDNHKKELNGDKISECGILIYKHNIQDRHTGVFNLNILTKPLICYKKECFTNKYYLSIYNE